MWSSNVNLVILDYNKNVIDFYIMSDNMKDNNISWRGTAIYGSYKSN